MRARRFHSIVAVAAATALALSACGSSDEAATSSSTDAPASSQESSAASSEVESSTASSSAGESTEGSAAAGAGFPITIEHALGTTVIESKPERVATVQWANH